MSLAPPCARILQQHHVGLCTAITLEKDRLERCRCIRPAVEQAGAESRSRPDCTQSLCRQPAFAKPLVLRHRLSRLRRGLTCRAGRGRASTAAGHERDHVHLARSNAANRQRQCDRLRAHAVERRHSRRRLHPARSSTLSRRRCGEALVDHADQVHNAETWKHDRLV